MIYLNNRASAGVDVNTIFHGQENVFGHFLGSFPSLGPRYHSPFRSDNNPDCRFEMYKGKWYFVDNATYRGKLRFNCIELVMYMLDIKFQEAVNLIGHEVDFSNLRGPISEVTVEYPIEIRTKPVRLNVHNYFTRKAGISVDYLHSQGVTGVSNYWCSTKFSPLLRINPYGSPSYMEVYQYLINGEVELYLPRGKVTSFVKTKSQDYVSDKLGPMVLVEGNKDRMVLDYYYGHRLNAYGLYSVSSVPDLSAYAGPVYGLLDPDDAGIKATKSLQQKYSNFINLQRPDNTLDVFDLASQNKTQLDEIIDQIPS